jgi:DNA modification methylase
MMDAGYLVHQPVIWVKPSFVIGRLHYHPRSEWALHGWLQGNGKCPFYGERNQSDVWEVDRENDKVHPTQKPVELFAKPIRNHTREGEICYEPFAGSGTQYISGTQLSRIVYGLELEPRYVDVTIQRYINHVGSDEHVFVERKGKRLSWKQAQKKLPKVV